MPKILADENVESGIVNFLRSLDTDVEYISKETKGIADEEVLKIATKERRLILTNDRNFAYKIYLEGKFQYGIILFRFYDQRTLIKLEALKQVLKVFTLEQLAKKFSIISENGIKFMS